MKTNDLFKVNRSSKRLNESLQKFFGSKINLENFDLPELQDARNKLRTHLSQVRSESGFNENIENDAYSKAQWMLDAINSEITEREEFIADAEIAERDFDEDEIHKIIDQWDRDMEDVPAYGMVDNDRVISLLRAGNIDEAVAEIAYSYTDQDGGEIPRMDAYIDDLQAEIEHVMGVDESLNNEDQRPVDNFGPEQIKDLEKINDLETLKTRAITLISTSSQKPMKPEKVAWLEGEIERKKDKVSVIKLMWDLLLAGEGMKVVGSKSSYRRRFGDSIDTKDIEMNKINEGEVQQASAIVTAKTMVDRVGRWIEELSGMENETLLQLGDQIRDEMGAEQARQFIESVSPGIQEALSTLKTTRETISSGLRVLTGEEQDLGMLGSDAPEMGDEEIGAAPPDEMNMGGEEEMGPPDDEFGAADPAAGGVEAAGREQRESIQYENNLLRVLAG